MRFSEVSILGSLSFLFLGWGAVPVFVAMCWLFLLGMNGGYSLVVVHRLLTAMASLVVEHRL